MTQDAIVKIFATFQQACFNPQTELIYHTAFELLVAVMLSAQATDRAVNQATKKLFAVANTPDAILKLGITELKSYIKNIGLYHNKSLNLIKTCHMLLTNFGGEVPATRAELMLLPGVGRKTANVILNTYFKQPVIAVDTHVARVAQRLRLVARDPNKALTVLAIEEQLMQNIPHQYLLNAHHWLILHGRYICQARKPKCDTCNVQQWCVFPSMQNQS